MIPIEDVAADARALTQAYRESGAASFRDLGVPGARARYTTACLTAGPLMDDAVVTREIVIADVPCREYRSAVDTALTPRPTLLFLHGGGWVIGDLDTHDLVCRDFARESGARVISVHYRLAPEHSFPAAHDDVTVVAHALLADGSGIADPERIVIVGDSAGGNLATWVAAQSAQGHFAHRLRGQVLFYPVTDLTGAHPSYRRIVEGFPVTADTMQWFAELYVPDAQARREPRLSPLLHPIVPGQPPTFICTVGLDPLADEGIAFAAALASAGIAVEHHHLPDYAHGLLTSAGKIPTAQMILGRAAAFARRLLE